MYDNEFNLNQNKDGFATLPIFPAPDESDNSRLVRVDVYRGDEVIEDFKDSEEQYEEMIKRLEGS